MRDDRELDLNLDELVLEAARAFDRFPHDPHVVHDPALDLAVDPEVFDSPEEKVEHVEQE
jgi:hypothetical protein